MGILMKIAVLNGSPHKKGNTTALVNAFKEGAESAGHEVEVLQVGTMSIAACKACEYCHGKGEGMCIQNDDMCKVYPCLNDADMIVFASPVHYFGITGQLQSTISRFYCQMKPAAKQFALLLSSMSPNVYAGIEGQYKIMAGFFEGEDKGIFEYNGDQNGSEAALAEVKAFGAGL